jgi:hypothetical protein
MPGMLLRLLAVISVTQKMVEGGTTVQVCPALR